MAMIKTGDAVPLTGGLGDLDGFGGLEEGSARSVEERWPYVMGPDPMWTLKWQGKTKGLPEEKRPIAAWLLENWARRGVRLQGSRGWGAMSSGEMESQVSAICDLVASGAADSVIAGMREIEDTYRKSLEGLMGDFLGGVEVVADESDGGE